MNEKNTKEDTSTNPKYGPPLFKVGEEVHLVAFLQGKPVTYYVCKAIVEKTPGPEDRRIYKVRVIAVAEKAVGGKIVAVPPQACLLNRVITKRENELNKTMAAFMLPKRWITVS